MHERKGGGLPGQVFGLRSQPFPGGRTHFRPAWRSARGEIGCEQVVRSSAELSCPARDYSAAFPP